MAEAALRTFVNHFHAAAARTDAELLARFAAAHDEGAFAELVGRYGRLVRHVCRNVLANEQDAEEALQATFLLLARKAGSLRRPGALAGWLHGVAYRTALRARRDSARRRAREVRAPIASAAPTAGPVAEASWRELQAILDEELQRLPEKLRAPFVLCCLERQSKAEAARLLGWKPGTVSGRLDEARKRLRQRLTRRGVSLSAVLCGLAVAGGARAGLPPAFAAETARSAVRFLGGGAAAAGPAGELAGAVLRGTLLARVRAAAVLLLALGTLSAGIGASLGDPPTPAPGPQAAAPPAPGQPAAAEQVRPRVDRFGDALPDRAIARLGTRRFGHSFLTEKVLWSPDGKVLASLGGYSTGRRLCLWDAATGKELHDLPAQGSVAAAAFSPNGKVLAAMEERTGVVLWDVATGKRLHDFSDKIYGQALAFAPDGKTLAASGENHVIRIWDVATASATAELTGHTDRLWDLAYAPDGKTLASTSHDKTLRLWDVAARREVWQRSPFGDGIGAVRFARDGKTLAAVGNDATVRILDAATGQELRSFGGGLKHWGFAVDYSPDGRTLATAGPDGWIRLWDPATGKELRRWGAGMLQVHSVAFSPDGRSLASSGARGTTIRLWDPATGKELRPTPGHHSPVTALTFGPDGKTLWSWGQDKALLRWDVATGQHQSLFGGPMNGALDWTAFTADGRILATGGRVDQRVRLWGTDGTERATLGTHDGRVLGVVFSPDGKLLVSGGDDGQIRLWDVEARKELRRMAAPADRWGQFVFSPDGRRLAAASVAAGQEAHNAPRVFDVASGKEVVKLDEPLTEATLAFSPDGRTLAVAGGYRDPTVRLVDAATGKVVGRCEGHTKGVWSLAFSPDSRYLATGGFESDDLVRLWEVATCQEVARFTGHHSGVGALAFTPDGRTLASGAGDATILLWDLTGLAPDGRPRPERLSPAGLGQCWDNLRGDDAAAAYRAVWGLAADPVRSVPFLRERLRPVPAAEPAVLARHLADLDADAFEIRQRAETELTGLGDAAEPALRKLAAGAPAPHVRKRAEGILDALVTSPDRLRSRRAVAALEYAATPEARQLLQALANGMPGAWLTAEARAALGRLSGPTAGRP